MRRTTFLDDLTGEVIDSEDFEPTRLSVNGRHWEIDLSEESFKKLEKVLEKFLKNATEVRGSTYKKGVTPRVNPETSKIRQWAKDNGLDVGDKGRIDSRIIEAYRHQNPDLARKDSNDEVEEIELEDLV